MRPDLKFRVLTLNCWGVFTPICCEKRHERLSAIAEVLSSGYYDIILLQEIWTISDYEKFREKIKVHYTFSHYFHSNVIGSGCCIFTKFKIRSCLFHQFPDNGYPHAVYHGDWFGGKGVGLAVLEMPNEQFVLNAYVTHFHARYKVNEKDNPYKFHLISQAYEMAEFIRMTSDNCDAVIVGGDFNMNKSMLGLKLFIASAEVNDTWYTRENIQDKPSEMDITTSDRPDNPYSNKNWIKSYPYGERLDYIFFKNKSQVKLSCLEVNNCMGKVPWDDNMHFSDHEGVEAYFHIESRDTLKALDGDTKELKEDQVALWTETLKAAELEKEHIRNNRFWNVICSVLILLSIFIDLPTLLLQLASNNTMSLNPLIGRLLVGLEMTASFMFLWYAVVIRTAEYKVVLNICQYMNLRIFNNKSDT